LNIVCCQIDIVWEDKPANHRKVAELLRKARLADGTLVVLPEMFSTGFSMNLEGISDGTQAQSERFLESLSRELGIYIVGGVVTQTHGGRGRNEAVAFSPQGELLARYAKIHPFRLGGESEVFEQGTQITSFRWQECVVTPFVCYDLRFPEVFRSAIKRSGTHLFLVIANWPAKRESHWKTLLQARAIENQAYVVGVNRCGADPKHAYQGCSMIVDPQGRVVAELGSEEGVVRASIDLAALDHWRREFPALSDMRWGVEGNAKFG
jgi:omega-amidase